MKTLQRLSMSRLGVAALVSAGLFVAVPSAAAPTGSSDQRSYGQRYERNERSWDQHRFSDRDRDEVNRWFRGHSRYAPVGLRERDRLPASVEFRLGSGFRLDGQYRSRVHWIPRDLETRLQPAPRGYRYAFVGGRLCLIDNNYRVVDTLYVGFGR